MARYINLLIYILIPFLSFYKAGVETVHEEVEVEMSMDDAESMDLQSKEWISRMNIWQLLTIVL